MMMNINSLPVCANTNSDIGFKSLLPSSQEWGQNCKQTSKVGLAVSSALSVSAANAEDVPREDNRLGQ